MNTILGYSVGHSHTTNETLYGRIVAGDKFGFTAFRSISFGFPSTYFGNLIELPDIGKLISKHLSLLHADSRMKALFPQHSVTAVYIQKKQ